MASLVEVDKAKEEGRHELVLTGDAIASKIAEKGLDSRVFQLLSLNFLEISKCNLKAISAEIGHLVNLTNLVLHGNHLTSVPGEIELLQKLKYLDLSNNELKCLPETMVSLKELQTLNVRCNHLEHFIDPSGLVQLHILDLSHNRLVELPEGIADAVLEHLGTVLLNHNQLEQLPGSLCDLPALKILDVSSNNLKEIPSSLCNCGKLKELQFSDNKLKDRRLAKMMGQCSVKAILDYLRPIYDKEQKAAGATAGGKKDKKKRGGKGKDKEVEEVCQNMMKVLHFNADESLTVTVSANAASVRPFIVCCIVRNLNFLKSRNMMKRFIVLQTKLHDGICNKRQAATIATHDLDAVKGPLVYDAKLPTEIKIVPLLKRNERTAANLVARLRMEAEELRKEKKRNTVSGIHKYLDLLKGKELYPCLVDSTGVVISFPPITNSDVTKITQKTRNIFVEVTSSQSLEVCKKVMEELLASLLAMGIGQIDPLPPVTDAAVATSEPSTAAVDGGTDDGRVENEIEDDEALQEAAETGGDQTGQVLVLQQIRVLDSLGSLKVIYPSRVDLQSESYHITRDYE